MDEKIRPWIVLILILIVFVFAVVTFIFWGQIKSRMNQFVGKSLPGFSTTVPVKPTQSPVQASEGEGKADLFIAELDYNQANGTVTQIRAEKKQRSIPLPLLPQLPKEGISSNIFAYKIEVWNLKQEITFNGWILGFKRIMQTAKGTYKLTLTVPYQANSFVKVYLPDNKLIWTGKMD